MAEPTDQRLPEAVRLVVGGVPFEEAIAQTLVNPDRLGDALRADRNALLSEIDRLRAIIAWAGNEEAVRIAGFAGPEFPGEPSHAH